MAVAVIPPELLSLLENFGHNLTQLKSHLNQGEVLDESIYNAEDFWKNLEEMSQFVSHQSIMLYLLIEKPPLPSIETFQDVLKQLELALNNIVCLYLKFPISQGKIFRKSLQSFILRILPTVELLCHNIINSSSNIVRAVGDIKVQCESLGKLPRNNREAVLRIFLCEEGLVIDAKDELKDAIENAGENNADDELRYAFMQNGIRIPCPDQWIEEDYHFIRPCLKMVEVYATCLKKTSKIITDIDSVLDEQFIADLDAVGELVKDSSTFVDDLVSSLYPPINSQVVRHQASLLRMKTIDLLNWIEQLRFCTEVQRTFVELFKNALNISWDQLNGIVVS